MQGPMASRSRFRFSVANLQRRLPVIAHAMLIPAEGIMGNGQVSLGADGISSKPALSPDAQTSQQPSLVPGQQAVPNKGGQWR